MDVDYETFKQMHNTVMARAKLEEKYTKKEKPPPVLRMKTWKEDSFPALNVKKPVIRIPQFKLKNYTFRKKYSR